MKKFTEEIIQALADRLPDTEIEVREISKSGEKRLTGLCIRSPQTTIAPVLYLDESYMLYRQGASIQDIADKLLEVYQQNTLTAPFDPSVITDRSIASDRICVRLINVPHNGSYLEDKVFEPIAGTDIALMYYIDLDDIKGGATTPVTQNLLMAWGISPRELHDIAIVNLARLHPPKVQPLYAVMQQMLGSDGPLLDDGPSMFVITCEKMLYGAALALIPDVAEDLEEHLGGFYLLPSSVHEMIAIPSAGMDPQDLLRMVTEINHTQVEERDRLSDDVYTICNGNLVSVFANDPDTRCRIQKKTLSWLPFPEVEI